MEFVAPEFRSKEIDLIERTCENQKRKIRQQDREIRRLSEELEKARRMIKTEMSLLEKAEEVQKENQILKMDIKGYISSEAFWRDKFESLSRDKRIFG